MKEYTAAYTVEAVFAAKSKKEAKEMLTSILNYGTRFKDEKMLSKATKSTRSIKTNIEIK